MNICHYHNKPHNNNNKWLKLFVISTTSISGFNYYPQRKYGRLKRSRDAVCVKDNVRIHRKRRMRRSWPCEDESGKVRKSFVHSTQLCVSFLDVIYTRSLVALRNWCKNIYFLVSIECSFGFDHYYSDPPWFSLRYSWIWPYLFYFIIFFSEIHNIQGRYAEI